MHSNGYQQLVVWEKSHNLVLYIYKITKKFPNDEQYCLVNQIRRAVISVSANIVEGHTRKSMRDFYHFLSIANGSLTEVEYYLLLAKDLNYISLDEYDSVSAIREDTGRLLYAFMKSIQKKIKP